MVIQWQTVFSGAPEMRVTALKIVSERVVNGVWRIRDTTGKISPGHLGAGMLAVDEGFAT